MLAYIDMDYSHMSLPSLLFGFTNIIIKFVNKEIDHEPPSPAIHKR